MSAALHILDVGLVNALGLSAVAVAAAARAGVSRLVEGPLTDQYGAPITTAFVPDTFLPPLDPALARSPDLPHRERRMLRLAARALAPLADTLAASAPPPLLLNLPDTLPGRRPIGGKFLQHLQRQTGASIDPTTSEVLLGGRAGGLALLRRAFTLLDRGTPRVLVGGVDTYCDPALIGRLCLDDRVASRHQSDAFAPGEGAAFILLARRPGEPSAWSDARVHLAHTAVEPGHLYSDAPYRAEALAGCVRDARTDLDTAIASTFIGFNGENHWAKEWGIAVLRNRDAIADDLALDHPAEGHGDLGAATGPTLLALAAIAVTRGHRDAPSLVCASSDTGLRAAVCLTHFVPPRSPTP